jgi:hypothetical protein
MLAVQCTGNQWNANARNRMSERDARMQRMQCANPDAAKVLRGLHVNSAPRIRVSVSLAHCQSTENRIMAKPAYHALAHRLIAARNCEASNNAEWRTKHIAALDQIVRNHFPHGSGFDSGVTFEYAQSKPDRLVFTTAFHHMDENGFYDGWSNHQIIVTPSLAFGFNVRITGRDRNQIKDYIADVFGDALRADVED